MKHWIPLSLLLTLLFLGCKDDEPTVQTPTENPACEEVTCPVPPQEFYGTGLMNGACWEATLGLIDTSILSSTGRFYVNLYNVGTANIGESMRFSLNGNTNLNDTIWLGWAYDNDTTPNLARSTYEYLDDHTIAGTYSFQQNAALTYKDYLLIDYFNADTTIVEGRFQVRFTKRSVSNFVTHAPDSMRIECGRFRARAR